MRKHIARGVFVMAIAGSACSGPAQDQESESPRVDAGQVEVGAAERADSMQHADSLASHAGHPTTNDTAQPAADSHAQHDAAIAAGSGAAAGAHTGHAAPAGRQTAAGHVQHAAARRAPARDEAPHAGHAARALAPRDTAHAAHGDTAHAAHVDTMHAAHVDTMHAAHVDTAHVDTMHAAHADTMHAAQDTMHAAHVDTIQAADMGAEQQMPGVHRMWMRQLGTGWTLMGMAQAHPIVSTSLAAGDGTALDATELYLTQPAVMFNVESPGSRFTLRTTLNFEGLTQPDGELTFGGWGEGFLDRRHPHTLLHELMLSMNLWDVAGGALSISAGKGFAPYGTDDPMSRPVVKYPTNHHLSQILERWTVNGVWINRGWSLEAALFGGGEPEGPYDFSNIESFGNSWSARVARRFGAGFGPMAEWEASASFGRVREVHDDEALVTKLYNAALRHERMYSFGTLYGLVEGSLSDREEGDGFFSVLGEAKVSVGAHRPYYRIEYATRPEYAREGEPGTEQFFRYDHDAHPIGATRWLINSIGYSYELTGYPVSARPFIEVQHNRVAVERGGIEPRDVFGRRSFWGLTAGFRVFLGGNPMRMGSYGVLDAMTSLHRGHTTMAAPAAAGGAHGDHK